MRQATDYRARTDGRPVNAENVLAVASVCLVLGGCGGNAIRVVHGTVTVGGEKVPEGHLLFVPIQGTPGPNSSGRIVDGQYRIEARGGVPVGTHRVQVRAMAKTGRKIVGRIMGDQGLVDELVTISPPEYDSPQSPLIKEVTAAGDGRIDIEIPGTSPLRLRSLSRNNLGLRPAKAG